MDRATHGTWVSSLVFRLGSVHRLMDAFLLSVCVGSSLDRVTPT